MVTPPTGLYVSTQTGSLVLLSLIIKEGFNMYSQVLAVGRPDKGGIVVLLNAIPCFLFGGFEISLNVLNIVTIVRF